jgi:copper homeostasis protein
MKIEICIDSVEGAIAAEDGGADRVELCDNLLEGGTTPSAGMIRTARARAKLGLMVIIRPRGGDFLFTDCEFDVMKEDVRMAKELGADGVVIGCLRPDGTIDRERTAALAAIARPLSVTFHRAFDMAADPIAALEGLISLGMDRVLTSGQEASAVEGIELIAALQKRAAGRIVVMPGGGITPRNVGKIIAATGVTEVHMSARTTLESAMTVRSSRVFMGGAFRPPEFSRKVTDAKLVRAVVDAVRLGR